MVIFVANFDKQTDEDDLETLFSTYGEVTNVRIFLDRETGESLGYAFVEMPDDHGAERAIRHLNRRWWYGRNLKVNQRRPRRGYDDD